MFNLSVFLDSDVRDDGLDIIKHLQEIRDNPKEEGYGYDLTSITKRDDGRVDLAVDEYVFRDIEELIISWDDLLAIIKKWAEIKSQNTKYILIEHKDDIWDVRGSNDKEVLLNS